MSSSPSLLNTVFEAADRPEAEPKQQVGIGKRIAKDFIYYTTNKPFQSSTSDPSEGKPAEGFKNPWEDAVIFIVVLTLLIISIVILMTFIIIRLERTKPEELPQQASASKRSSATKSTGQIN